MTAYGIKLKIYSFRKKAAELWRGVRKRGLGVNVSVKAAIDAGKPVPALLDRDCLFSRIPAETLVSVLTPDERVYLDRLGHKKIRLRYLAGRAVLRALLTYFTGTLPPELLFGEGPTGPPLDVYTREGFRFVFSMSHTRPYTFFGFYRSKGLGVDIEALRPVRHMLELAAYAYSQEESKWLQGLPAGQRPDAFIRIWTRKEAVIKYYRGTIAADMHKFTVPLVQTPGVFDISPHLRDDRERLHMMDFEFDSKTYGAMCWEGEAGEVETYRIDPDFVQTCLLRYRELLQANR